MPTKFFRTTLPLLLLLLLAACARSEEAQPPRASTISPSSSTQLKEPTAKAEEPPPKVEEPPPPAEEIQEPSDEEAARRMSKLPPPTVAQVTGAVERVFKGAAVAADAQSPRFVVGDFNGDFSQDVAVVVRPAPGRLTDINDELANWILVQPLRPPPPAGLPYPEAHARAAERRRVQAEEADVLVAVIHGHEAEGWRDPRATQTYVLKGAAGERFRTRARRELLKTSARGRLPRLRGDVIAQDLGGQTGFLYYDGAKYDWYDPRTYTPPTPARVVHGGALASAPRPMKKGLEER